MLNTSTQYIITIIFITIINRRMELDRNYLKDGDYGMDTKGPYLEALLDRALDQLIFRTKRMDGDLLFKTGFPVKLCCQKMT